ncbi:MAG TPA: hypothetical protein VMD30_00260 [Tepidisphaeraceae bacterium]|nr:hypothetical protein [Tepidisphaeraceae bacterium]
MSGKTQQANGDKSVQRIKAILDKEYAAGHPSAKVDVYRQDAVSVRIRVIDPDFRGKNRVERDDLLWAILERLPEQDREDITMVIPLTPQEQKESLANFEFEHPTKSDL